jgi:Holliday junction resolvase-like predicted endonuclease
MIDKRKLRRVRAAAEAFLVIRSDLASKFKKYRVDAVCIDSNQNMEIQNIRHYNGIY